MIIRFIKKQLLYKKIKSINYNQFSNKKKTTNNVVLIEFNSFHVLHIIFAYLSNYFKDKNNLTIKAFYSHILLSYPLERSIRQKISSYFGEIFNINFFGIYKSFGVEEFIFPGISKSNKKKSKVHFQKIIKKLKKKKDILKIKIDSILLGDLIYDAYLTRNKKQKPTIDINSDDFNKFLFQFISLFFAWQEIFIKNNVKTLLVSHSCYTMGIPVRISLRKKVLTFEVKENRLKRLDYSNLNHYSETTLYPSIFKKFDNNQKKTNREYANINLNKRFEGSTLDLPYVTNSAFNKKVNKINPIIKKTKKIKILILPHDFVDAPHIAGDFVFADMYEWVKYLSAKSNEKIEYEWYLKTHPKMGDKYKWYQNFTKNIINKLTLNSRIKILNPDTTHNEIINSGIDFVFTVFGTPAHEYAFKGVSVVNASIFNPHSAYKFNIHTNKLSEYDKIIDNLKKIKLKIKKKKVLEFYYMHFLYASKDWFFNDYAKMLKFLGNYHYQWSDKFYEYWILNSKNNSKKEFYAKITRFIDSKDLIFSIKHQNK